MPLSFRLHSEALVWYRIRFLSGILRIQERVSSRANAFDASSPVLSLQTVMRRNSVYVAFIIGGALLGERVCLSNPKQILSQMAHKSCSASYCTALLPFLSFKNIGTRVFRMVSGSSFAHLIAICAGLATKYIYVYISCWQSCANSVMSRNCRKLL